MLGALMGAVLELPKFTRFRWELDDLDFNRIWSFCFLLNVILVVYVFTNNEASSLEGPSHGLNVATAAKASAFTAMRFLRWLPLTTFPFVVAQFFNARPSVPLTAISLVLRWRRRRGDRAFADRYHDISFPYFFVCLFSAGIHPNDGGKTYFFGQAILIIWALWSVRAKRFKIGAWLLALGLVLALGFLGMFGINRAESVIQNFGAQLAQRFMNPRTDPLQSRTSMGRIGQMKLSAKIVIRLEPQSPGNVPSYLREASYRNYHSQKMAWFAGGGTNGFTDLTVEPDNTSWILQPDKKSFAGVNIACYLNGWSRELEVPEGLLPLPSGCVRLENTPPYMILKANKTGAVLAAGRGLMIFDALYGHGSLSESLPDVASTNHYDLSLPPSEVPTLEKIIAEIKVAPDADELAKRRAVEGFFLNHFTYSLWQGEDKRATTNQSPLTKFLLTSRSGHCEYFATATVLLLREMGIPARYAVGYAVHEARGTGFVVRDRDAHAWCLVWNQKNKTWDDFDTTPPAWVAVESQRTAGDEWLADLRAWISFQLAKLRWRQAELQQYIFWSLIPVMLVLLYFIIFKRRGKLRKIGGNKNVRATDWPGLDSEFYALEKKLAARGIPRQTGESLADWLERALAEPALASLRSPLAELLRLHYAHRFDPAGLSPEKRVQLKQDAAVCLEKIATVYR